MKFLCIEFNVSFSQFPLIVKIGVTTPTRIRCMSTSPISSQNASEAQVQRDKVLTSTDDYYGGVIVELDQPMDSTTFVSILRASILHWKQLVVFNFTILHD